MRENEVTTCLCFLRFIIKVFILKELEEINYPPASEVSRGVY